MDPLFTILAVTGAVGYGWMPVRDQVCKARGHKKGAERLRATFEDGSYETERLCLCRKTSTITLRRAFADRKEGKWVAPALATTPAPSL